MTERLVEAVLGLAASTVVSLPSYLSLLEVRRAHKRLGDMSLQMEGVRSSVNGRLEQLLAAARLLSYANGVRDERAGEAVPPRTEPGHGAVGVSS